MLLPRKPSEMEAGENIPASAGESGHKQGNHQKVHQAQSSVFFPQGSMIGRKAAGFVEARRVRLGTLMFSAASMARASSSSGQYTTTANSASVSMIAHRSSKHRNRTNRPLRATFGCLARCGEGSAPRETGFQRRCHPKLAATTAPINASQKIGPARVNVTSAARLAYRSAAVRA